MTNSTIYRQHDAVEGVQRFGIQARPWVGLLSSARPGRRAMDGSVWNAGATAAYTFNPCLVSTATRFTRENYNEVPGRSSEKVGLDYLKFRNRTDRGRRTAGL
jgi:hypothetical protein